MMLLPGVQKLPIPSKLCSFGWFSTPILKKMSSVSLLTCLMEISNDKTELLIVASVRESSRWIKQLQLDPEKKVRQLFSIRGSSESTPQIKLD